MKGDEGVKSLKRCLSIHCSAGDSEEGEESGTKFGQQLMKLNKNPFRYQEDFPIEISWQEDESTPRGFLVKVRCCPESLEGWWWEGN